MLFMPKKRKLRSQINTNHTHEYDAYKMIATNVLLFYALIDLPIVLDLARLDEGGGIEETLRRNKAK